MDGTTDAALRIVGSLEKLYGDAYYDLLIVVSAVIGVIGIVVGGVFPFLITLMQGKKFKEEKEAFETSMKDIMERDKKLLRSFVRKEIRYTQTRLRRETQEEVSKAKGELTGNIEKKTDDVQEELIRAQDKLRSELKAAADKTQKELKDKIDRAAATAQGGIFHVQGNIEYNNKIFLYALNSYCLAVVFMISISRISKAEESNILVCLNGVKDSLPKVTAEKIRGYSSCESTLKHLIKKLKSSEKYQKDGQEIEKLYQDLLDKESAADPPEESPAPK